MKLLFSSLLLLPLLICSALSASSCSTNLMTATQTVTSPVAINTSPLDPYQNIKLSAVNRTAWEQYYFDSVSADGSAGIAINFIRDASLASLARGVLRVRVDAVWPNGTKWTTNIFVNESCVTTCALATTGLWATAWQGIAFQFNISQNLTTASLSLTGPNVQGTWDIRSLTPPRTPDGSIYPSPHADVQFAPLLYWNEAIPLGKVTADLVIAGTSLTFTGYGGHDRNWAPFNWDSIAKSWYWLRGIAGPYSFVFWSFTSAVDNTTYTSAFVSENGTEIFATRNSQASDTAAYATLALSYGGKVHGTFADTSTGMTINMVEAGGGTHWRFSAQHANIAFETEHGTYAAYSRFVDGISGGLVGREVYGGVSISEQSVIVMPGVPV
jgi:hypothetical protein